MSPIRPFATGLALGLVSFGTHAQDDAPAARPLQLMDIFELEYADDPQLSPDGNQVVYVRTSMDIMEDRRASSLWWIDVETGTQRPLTQGPDDHSPRWSPDGGRLLYVSADDDGAQQLLVRWMDTGDTANLCQLADGAGDLVWSSDGRQVAFSQFVNEPVAALVELPQAPAGANWADAPQVIEELHYRHDGGGYADPGHVQLFVLPAEGGTPRQVTEGPFDHGPPSWLPDGEGLVFAADRREGGALLSEQSEIWQVSLVDGSLRNLSNRPGWDESPVVSPDGRHVAWLGCADELLGYLPRDLYVRSLDDDAPARVLTADLDRDVAQPLWSSGLGGPGCFVRYDDHGDTKLALVSLHGGRQLVAQDLGGLSVGRPYDGASYSTNAAGDRVAFTHGTTQRLADVAVSWPDGRLRVLTDLNGDLFGQRSLGRVEEIWFASAHDGLDVQGWIVYPPDFDRELQYPLLLEIHGGPFANYGSRFSMEAQLYAAAGYVVLYCNPRGSTSYGADFGNEIHHEYPGHDYDDLMSGVDAVIERGFIDEDQLYVTGGSGGGVLTAWIVGKTDRFRAAVVAKPVINWASFVLTADAYTYFWRYWFGETPWDAPEAYWARSPLSLVGNVSTPTMLLTGEQDYRTPISESEQYYQALKLREVPTALVRIPGASHGIAKRPSQLMAKVAHILGWFDRHAVDEPE